MSVLTREEVLIQLNGGVDPFANTSFRAYFGATVRFELVSFKTYEEFSSLIWHFSPSSRLLTPSRFLGMGKLYTVKDVACRMIDKGYTFKDLALGRVSGKYDPYWFESCLAIYTSFNWDKCLPFMLLPAAWTERWDCPKSLFRIIDGMHRSLVISYMVEKRELTFRPIKGIVMHMTSWLCICIF